MSQEQRDRVQQQEPGYITSEGTQDASASEPNGEEGEVYIDVPVASGKKRKKRRFRERLVYESEISPKPSMWPLALAFAISLLLFGLIYNVYFLVIGTVLVIVCVMGWVLERQKA